MPEKNFWILEAEGPLFVKKMRSLKGGYPIIIECFSQLSFDSEVYTKSTTAADFVYTYESNESCEKHSMQR